MTTFAIDDDLETLLITHDQATPMPCAVQYTTAEVEALLSTVGCARRGMLPPIPEKWAPSQQVTEAIRDPKLYLETENFNGDPVLRIRHPHFGWLHFVFSRSKAAGLGRALIVRANADPPATAGRP